MERIGRALHDGDLTSFVDGLRREAWTLSDACVTFQVRLIEVATLNDRGEFITALLDLDPAVLRRQPPPPSQAIEFAFTYAKTHLLPLLLRIWPLPDDLPHAAGNGDLARVRRWFDAEGKPALGDVANHAPATSVHPREPQWGGVGVQQVLDTALAWSVLNHHFDVADFLLEHGADINTNWNSHEPASILHTLVFEDAYEAMRFLIDRGIDMTIKDYRWDSHAGVGRATARTTRRWPSGWRRRNGSVAGRHQRDSMSGSFLMKMRMSPICAAVEMKSNAVGLTVVVRRSRMAVSAAGKTGHSSSRPSTLIQAVMSSIASTSAAPRASHGVPASRCCTSVRRSATNPRWMSRSTQSKIVERRDELLRHEHADVLVQHRPAHFERCHEVVIDQERVGRALAEVVDRVASARR